MRKGKKIEQMLNNFLIVSQQKQNWWVISQVKQTIEKKFNVFYSFPLPVCSIFLSDSFKQSYNLDSKQKDSSVSPIIMNCTSWTIINSSRYFENRFWIHRKKRRKKHVVGECVCDFNLFWMWLRRSFHWMKTERKKKSYQELWNKEEKKNRTSSNKKKSINRKV